MKLEFLEYGSPDCPLVRLYEFTSQEAYDFRRIALQLARGREHTVFLNERAGYGSDRGLRINAPERKQGSRSVRNFLCEVQMGPFPKWLASGSAFDSALFARR